MDGRNYFLKMKKHYTLEKKLFPARFNIVNYIEKMFFRNNYFGSQSFFMSCHFTKIFVHLLIISVVSNFNVSKLIGWDPANTYLFKVSTNTKKKSKICSKLTVKTLESRSGIFILNLNIFHSLF